MKCFKFLAGILLAFDASGQGRLESFNKDVPANWTATQGSVLSLSSEHFKGGNKSLKWVAEKGAEILISDLNIPYAEIGSATAGSAQFYIYNANASRDTLAFQFLDSAGVIRREGRMLLNYSGWRDYHRSYRYDYNNGNELPAFTLKACRMLYKPGAEPGQRAIWFDEMRFVGDSERRFPGTHMVLDAQHFNQTASTAGGDSKLNLINWGKGADIPVTAATRDELAALRKIRSAYTRPVPSVTPAEVKAAKEYVRRSGITRNTDHTIKGRAITSLVNQDTLVMISRHCGSLARAFLKDQDEDARNKLILFTEYLLDQGLAEGGRNVITTNTYEEARTFPIGFLDALSIYPVKMREEVIKMLKWSVEYSKIYIPDYIVRLNIDYIHVKSNFLFEIALADSSDNVAVRDLKGIKRFLELNTEPADGGRDGIKPDGVGVHHQTHQMSYLFSYGTWIERAYSLKDTPFRISKKAYDNMVFAIKSLFLETSKGAIYSHSESGRKPFSTVPVKKGSVEKLIEIGADIIHAPFEPELAAFYNYIFAESKYPVTMRNLDGFYQFNYAQLGVLRKDNWVATMRGFTNQSFGAEIYKDQNVYGRYQSYGTLEVLYDGQLGSSGYISSGKGWDWNVMPGTTTVHLPYSRLRPATNGSRTEFQGSAFAGALALGKNGIFGMDFRQSAGSRYPSNNLTFRKSVFALGDFLVCLGTNINAAKSADNVATNLFQGVTPGTGPAIYVNSMVPVTGEYNATLPAASVDNWIVNAQTTGYYIPKGNGTVTISRGSQTTPLYTSFSGKQTAAAHASKAWINHGTEPAGANYHFVAVPAVTPERMQGLAAEFSKNSLYKVLKQTGSIHAVKYFPQNLISYVFFEGQENVDIGYVKSISNKALLGVQEDGDSLSVNIANPDLNTVSDPEPTIKWRSVPSQVTVVFRGNWKVTGDSSNASVSSTNDFTCIAFTLTKGFPVTVKMIRISESGDLDLQKGNAKNKLLNNL